MSIFPKVLFSAHSDFNGEVKVIEHHGERKLIASSYTQSRSLNNKGKTGSYWDGFVTNIPNIGKDSRVLILGLAGGTIAKLLTNKFGPIAIDGVDVDPLMVDLGRRYLDFHEKNVNVIIEDGLKFVQGARYKYDLIAVDLFANGGVAVGAESKEFFTHVKNLLTNQGLVVINKLFITKDELATYLEFLHSIFGKTNIFTFNEAFNIGNVIIYAYR